MFGLEGANVERSSTCCLVIWPNHLAWKGQEIGNQKSIWSYKSSRGGLDEQRGSPGRAVCCFLSAWYHIPCSSVTDKCQARWGDMISLVWLRSVPVLYDGSRCWFNMGASAELEQLSKNYLQFHSSSGRKGVAQRQSRFGMFLCEDWVLVKDAQLQNKTRIQQQNSKTPS